MAASSRASILIALGGGALIAFVATSHAQNPNDVAVAFHAFQDSRGVTVLSPDAAFERDFTDRTALRIKFGVDAISAASDSCVRCHPDGKGNSRVVTGVSVLRKYGDTSLTLGGEFSKENFYSATTFVSSIARNLNSGNTTVAGGFAYSLNRPGLHPSETVETQHSLDAYASATQSWTKTTITQVGYELNQINGFQTNPFLRTSLNGVMTLGNSPDARTRQAFSFRLRQALPASTYLDADYRRYIDSWSVDSNTVSFGLSHHFGDRVVGSGSYRWYDQSAAYFYAPSYTGSPEYYTADFRLFPFNSGSINGHLSITPKNGFFNMPAGTSLNLEYERYRSSTSFEAAIFTAGVRIPLK